MSNRFLTPESQSRDVINEYFGKPDREITVIYRDEHRVVRRSQKFRYLGPTGVGRVYGNIVQSLCGTLAKHMSKDIPNRLIKIANNHYAHSRSLIKDQDIPGGNIVIVPGHVVSIEVRHLT